jgi:hypothetical protein
MLRPALRLLTLALGVACVLAAGCSAKKTLVPDLPPQTSLFVQGPVDTVNHVVHLFWYGSDVDGSVVGFEFRLISSLAPADTDWKFTAKLDSVFTIFTPGGYAAPRFEVRAIDNSGQRDPTPAVEDFQFSNHPPIVTFNSPRLGSRDTSFATATISWTASDPDGDPSKLTFRLWLDGNAANPRTVIGNTFVVPTADFLQAGVINSGPRTLFIQATDDGGLAGPIDQMTWYVMAPVTGNDARLLIIDDAPGAGSLTIDTVYTNAAARNLPAGTFRVLKLEVNQPFRSSADMEQSFRQFKSVLWYRGIQATLSTLLQTYPDAIANYVSNGGSLYLEGLNLVDGQNSAGSLPNSFVSSYLGSDFLYLGPGANPADSTVSWSISSAVAGKPVILRSSLLADSLRQQQLYVGLRGFAVRDTNNVILWARSGNMSQPQPFDLPIGVDIPQPGGGRLMMVSTPLRGANGFFSVPRYVAKVLQRLGVTGP